MEITADVLQSVKDLGSKFFDNGKLRDIEMSFDLDEGGELCIRVSLYFDSTTTKEDFGNRRLFNFLFEVGEVCLEEYGNVLPWLDIHTAKELA